MLKRLRENKSSQGALLISPTLIFMIGLLIIPLLLTLVISFGRRAPDGTVIYGFSFDNYIRLSGIRLECADGSAVCVDPIYVEILSRSFTLAFNTTILAILLTGMRSANRPCLST